MRILPILILLLLAPFTGLAKSPVERYRAAEKLLQSHKREYDFLHDDSREAIAALQAMWTANADEVVQELTDQPAATAPEIARALCEMEPGQSGCDSASLLHDDVVQLGPRLFLISDFSSEVGTVFVVGPREGKPALLWSIGSATPQQVDRLGLVSAWRADRAGNGCRDKGARHKPGQCGGLYADIGLLTPDAEGRPRFYVDAGYSQLMGATIAKQTSVWRWDGDSATLLWIDLYGFMIDQKRGTEFKDGTLSIEEKDEFRSFYGCGSCEARQMLRELRITPTGVEDLGKVSTRPELDLIDELFYRLAYEKPIGDIADSQIAHLLGPQMRDAKRKSGKIARNWFSTGMLGDVAYARHGNLEQVCFTSDDAGRFYFTVKLSDEKPVFLERVEQAPGNYDDCSTSGFDVPK